MAAIPLGMDSTSEIKRLQRFEISLTEGGTIEVNSPREAKVLLEDVADDGKHGNTAVLHLHLSAAIELLSVAIRRESQRIPEANWRKSSKLILKAHLERSGSGGHTGRREGGDAEEGGEDGDELEHDLAGELVYLRQSRRSELACSGAATALLPLLADVEVKRSRRVPGLLEPGGS